MPDKPSLHDHVTVTVALYQPLPFAGGTAPEIDGAALSMFNVVDAEAALPALSDATPVTSCPAPSLVTCCIGEHVASCDNESLQVNDTSTSVLFQPAAFADGVC